MSVCRGGVWRWTKSVYQNSNPHPQAFPSGLQSSRVRATWGYRLHSAQSTAPPGGSSPISGTTQAGYSHQHDNDIFVDDLQATLEAHRATNRARMIRRVNAGSDRSVFRPDLPESHHGQDIAVKDASDTQASGIDPESPISAPSEVEDSIEDIQHSEITEKSALKRWDFWPIGSTQYLISKGIRSSRRRIRIQGPAEYHATVLEPYGESAIRGEVLEQRHWPWLSQMEGDLGGDASQRLVNEINAYERCMTASDLELQATRKVARRVDQLVRTTLKGSSCEVVGSHSTGLALPSSDIDFSVSLPAIEADAAPYRKSLRGLRYQKAYYQALMKLRAALHDDPDFGRSAELVVARVPIVRAVHQVTRQEVQIQMWTGNRRQEQYTLAYLAEYPTLRPLYFVLRSSLKIRNLGYTLDGGLGAYATLMLIVNVLKHASGHYDPLDVGNQLLHVLQFYTEADLYRHGWSVDPPRQMVKGKANAVVEEQTSRKTGPALQGLDNIAPTDPRYPYLLYLQDPADAANDLGSKSYAIKHIQSTFASIRNDILEKMQQWESQSESVSRSPSKVALLAPLVQARYMNLYSQRCKMREYGSSIVTREKWVGKRERSSAGTKEQQQKISAREMLGKVREVEKRKAAEKAKEAAERAKALPYLSSEDDKANERSETKKPDLSWGEYYKGFLARAQQRKNSNESILD
ncbi:MAG: hypothetical protein Q9174_002043 [Haloplaca sp. 1 TL-2023]